MSEPLVIRIESNAAEVVKRLGQFPPAMQAAIGATLNRENELTVGDIQASKLSHRGPRTLGVVTNRLRSSLRAVTRARSAAASLKRRKRRSACRNDASCRYSLGSRCAERLRFGWFMVQAGAPLIGDLNMVDNIS